MKRWTLITGLTLTAAAVVSVLLYTRGDLPGQSTTPQDFAKSRGLAEDFDVSPDDRRIVFSYYRDGVASLYTAGLDRSAPAAVTKAAEAHHLHPRFSPDGTRLLFVAVPVERSKQTSTLYVSHADGTGLKQLTDGTTIITEARFAPDGQTIYYIQAERYEEIASYRPVDLDLYSMSADGSNAKRLTQFKLDTMENLTLAPDGSKAVYESTDPKTFASRLEMVTLPTPGNRLPIALTGPFAAQQVRDPALLPNGQQILFSATVEPPNGTVHANELFLSDLSGTPAQPITLAQTADAVHPVPLHREPAALFLHNPDPTATKPDYKMMRTRLDKIRLEEILLNVQ